jgi:iron complex outermembrane receptor protein
MNSETREKRRRKGKNFKLILPVFLFFVLLGSTAIQNSFSDTINLGNANVISNVLSNEEAQLKKVNKVLTKQQIFKSILSEYVVNKEQLSLVPPVGGGIQALSLAPGVMVRGYNPNVGASRSQISMRGFNAGWNSATPDLNTNKLTNLFDGIPMDNLDGEWRSSALPFASMLQGVNIIYGPGNPDTRWFDSIGGTINSIPVQPTAKPGADVNLSAGSFNAYTEEFDLRTGLIDGWSTVIAAGNTFSNDFRVQSSNNLAKAQSLYIKTVKTLQNGYLSFAGYYTDAVEERPNFIPVNPLSDASTPGGYVTENGLDVPGPLYSQATSGFYASLPFDLKGKTIHINQYYLYSQLHLNLASDLTFNNTVWYRFGHDNHYAIQYMDYVVNGYPHTENAGLGASETYGDKAVFNLSLPYNDVKFGGYYANEKWNQLSYAPNINNSDPLDFSDDLNYYQYLSAFLQDTVKPLKNLNITPGLNFVSYNEQYFDNGCGYWLQNDPNFTADCEASQEGDPYDPNSQNPGSPNSVFRTQAIEPSVGINYRVLPFLALYGDYAVLYQNPDNGSFQYNSQAPGSQYSGALVPIQTFDSEIGAKFLVRHYGYLNRFIFNVNYYQDNMSRQTLQYQNPLTLVYYYSFASEFYKGYNIYLSEDPVKNLHVFADLNIQHNVYTNFIGQDGSSYDGYPISNSPDENFNIAVSYKIPYKSYLFKPEIIDQYIGKQYLYSNNLNPNAPFAPTDMTEPDYNIVNFNLDVKTDAFNSFIPDVKSADVNFNMYNVFDKEFNVIEYYSAGGIFGETPSSSIGDLLAEPGMPRAFYVSLSFHFGAPHE